MKHLTTTLIFLAGNFLYAQECNNSVKANYGEDISAGQAAVSLYAEPFKQKNYSDSRLFWWDAQKKSP